MDVRTKDVRTKVYDMVSQSDVDSIVDGKLINDVFNRLIGFGYTPTKSDVFNIGFSIIKVDNNIKNYCNITSIPYELYPTLVELCWVEILSLLFHSGKLDDTFDLNEVVKIVSVGDTSITFDNTSSVSEQINNLIVNLTQQAERSVLCFRKVKW